MTRGDFERDLLSGRECLPGFGRARLASKASRDVGFDRDRRLVSDFDRDRRLLLVNVDRSDFDRDLLVSDFDRDRSVSDFDRDLSVRERTSVFGYDLTFVTVNTTVFFIFSCKFFISSS